MNWNSISFDWNQARSFLAVAKEGSLSAAATALGLTQPTITRQLTALEATLEVTLLERTGRSVILTQAGFDLLEHVQKMAESANLMSLAASGRSQAIEGQVRITASEITAAYLLPPFLDQLRASAPKLEVDIVASNSVRDLQLREADIAIRHVRPEQSSLISKRICEDPMRFYATEKYIEHFGHPTRIEAPCLHQFVSFGNFERVAGYLSVNGLELNKSNFKYTTNSQLVELELARAGHVIAIMTDRIGSRFSEFKPVLKNVEPFTDTLWLVAHRELQTARRIRLVFDLLADFLSQ